MTLSTEIAALAGHDDAVTLRPIDAQVADLIGWWPDEYTRHCIHGSDRRYKATRGCVVSTEYLECPAFTTDIRATFAELMRRGWAAICVFGFEQYECDIWESRSTRLSHVCRDDQNLPLAALEALVRAVEGQG